MEMVFIVDILPLFAESADGGGWCVLLLLNSPSTVSSIHHHAPHLHISILLLTSEIELQTKVPEDFTITEKASTRAFSWLKVPTIAYTFKTILIHYAKQMLSHCKL